jgi:hypothetical protein
MHLRARQLLETGTDHEAATKILCEEFPGFMLTSGPEWRRDAVYQKVIAAELVALQRRRPGGSAGPTAMSPGLVAFAEARGLVCAYCRRAGTRGGDPDGLTWHRDSVPRGLQAAGRDLELACSGCRADGERYHQLGGDVDAV